MSVMESNGPAEQRQLLFPSGYLCDRLRTEAWLYPFRRRKTTGSWSGTHEFAWDSVRMEMKKALAILGHANSEEPRVKSLTE